MVQDDCKDCAPRRQLAAAVSASGRVTVPAAAALTPRYLGWMSFWRALGAVARRGRTARFGQAAAAAPPLLLPQLLQPVMRHHQQLPPRLARLFSTSTIDNASILGEQNADSSFIDSVAPSGLIGVNGCVIQGSVLVLPTMCLLWHVKSLEDVNQDTLSLIFSMHPRPEIFILGVGESGPFLSPGLRQLFRDNKISLEAMSRQNAAAQFNVLQEDGRRVAVGFPHAAPHIT